MTADVVAQLEILRDGINDFLASSPHIAGQRHLKADTVEHDYYYYGYVIAINDAIGLLAKKEPAQ